MKKISILIFLFMLTSQIFAQTYSIKKYVVGSSSQKVSNQEYIINSTAGQPTIGTVSNNDNIIKSGFWYKESSLGMISLVSPDDAAIGVANPPSFKWNFDAIVENYQLEISTNELFESPVQTIITADTFAVINGLSYNTKYFWRVKPYNSESEYKWSKIRSFITMLEIPQTSALVYSGQLLQDFWNGTTHKSVPIMLELRSGSSIASSVLYKRTSAIINNNGIAVGRFDDFQSGNYWLVVRAAGYAAISSNSLIAVNAASSIYYDFTHSNTSAYQPGMLALDNDRYVMKAGDFDANRRVIASDISLFKPNLGQNATILPASEDLADYTISESGNTIININVLLAGKWNASTHKPASIMVELRTGAGLSSSQLYKRTSGIISSSGIASISFENCESGQYWLVVRSAGYSPIASSQRIQINSGEETNYDFSNSSSSAYQAVMLLLSNGRYLMKPGDFDGNRRINSTDTGIIKPNIGANTSIIPAP